MVNSFLKGRFFVHETFLPQGFLGALDYNPYHLDIAKAKSLLAEAGYPNGFDLKLDTPNTSPFPEIAQSVQQTYGQAGVKVSITPQEMKSVLGVYRSRKHQLLLISWGPDYFDPHTNADAFARNTDNSDKPATKPLAWRNSWDIPEISKDDRGGGARAGYRQAREAVRGPAEEGDGRGSVHPACSRPRSRSPRAATSPASRRA